MKTQNTNEFITLLSPFQRFFKEKMNSGILLLLVTILALLVANSSFYGWYQSLWEKPVALQFGDINLLQHHGIAMNMGTFINDVLMTIFFFSVGLEIKREVLVGELHSFSQASLPIVAAIGGMICPVLIYYFTSDSDLAKRGCAIPMATDIAFSIGVLSLLGSRVPQSLKIFLTTFAVADDIGGIIVIALFYTTEMDLTSLYLAIPIIVLLLIGSKNGIKSKLFYVFLGIVVWYLFLQSGIHATIAGVIVAFTIPAKPKLGVSNYIESIRENIARFPKREKSFKNIILNNNQISTLKKIESASDRVISPLQDLEDEIHPIVNYVVMPLFAFSNAGICLKDMDLVLLEGVTLSTSLGLIFGKCIGIFIFTALMILFKFSKMPKGMNWSNLFGISLIGGIGFTVSLFIADLSFGNIGETEILNEAKLGVLLGSLISGILGYSFLNVVIKKKKVK